MTDTIRDFLGEFPVAAFFVISGFVLSVSYGEKLQSGLVSNKAFFLSRLFKFYPISFFILTIIVVLDWRLGLLCAWHQVIAHALLLQCWIPTHQFVNVLNAPDWFLSDIMFFYLIFKYLYRWLVCKNHLAVWLLMTIYVVGYIFLSLKVDDDYSSGCIYLFPMFRLIDFCLGILLYRCYCSLMGNKIITYIQTSLRAWQIYMVELCLGVVLIQLCLISAHVNPNLRCAALYWPFAIIVVGYAIAIDKSRWGIVQLLHNKYMMWLGNISFELFICHLLVFRITSSIFLRLYGEHACVVTLFCVSLVLTIAIAWFAKMLVVMPFYTKFGNVFVRK